ncbi:hypothetical protein C8R45DRAFT_1218220 [Mycena sanguinolenta]|nr:hypothetical protein C8R45DRAFT_1218220 [Mycena sanguinolenta]
MAEIVVAGLCWINPQSPNGGVVVLTSIQACRIRTHVVVSPRHITPKARSLLACSLASSALAGAASSSFPFSWPQPQFSGVFSHWQWLLSPLHLVLTLLATLLVFCAIRRSLTWRLRIGAKKAMPIAVPVVEKPLSSSPSSLEGGNETEKTRSWRGLLPSVSVNTLAEALPITLNGPPAPPMRGRHVYRGGRGAGFNVSTRRPEAALVTRPRVEAPMPVIYQSETPVSMVKMIMSRHRAVCHLIARTAISPRRRPYRSVVPFRGAYTPRRTHVLSSLPFPSYTPPPIFAPVERTSPITRSRYAPPSIPHLNLPPSQCHTVPCRAPARAYLPPLSPLPSSDSFALALGVPTSSSLCPFIHSFSFLTSRYHPCRAFLCLYLIADLFASQTYRAPSGAPRRSTSAPAPSGHTPKSHSALVAAAQRPPSPEEEGHARSASV